MPKHLGGVALVFVLLWSGEVAHSSSKQVDIDATIKDWYVNIPDESTLPKVTKQLLEKYDHPAESASGEPTSAYLRHLVSVGLHMAVLTGNSTAVGFWLDSDGDPFLGDELGRTALHVAAYKGNVDIVSMILAKDASGVDKKDRQSVTPLFMAAYNNQTDVCEVLLRFGANGTTSCDDGRTPLHLAAKEEFLTIAQILISHNPEILSVSDRNGYTALYTAAGNNRTHMVQLLLEKGASPYSVNKARRTPLHIAAGKGYRLVVQSILNKSIEGINMLDMNKYTPIGLAAYKNHTNVFEDLLSHGGDPSLSNVGRTSTLHQAAYNGNLRLLELLLPMFQSNINIQDIEGRTPLLMAASFNRIFASKMLLEKNASVSIRKNDGASPLHVAVTKRNVDIISLILFYSPESVDLIDNDHMTPLYYAARYNNTIISETLLNGNANVFLADHLGYTPLHFASIKNNIEVVKSIISKNASSLNVQNRYGETALHVAVDKKSVNVVKYLLEEGADPYFGNVENWTPLHYAVNKSDLLCAELIISKNKTGINYKTLAGYTPLFMLSRRRNNITDLYKLLLENGGDPFIKNKWGVSLLHLVIDIENIEVAELILANKDCVNFQAYSGETPLNYAVLVNSSLMVKYFLSKGGDPNIPEIHGRTPLFNTAFVGSLHMAEILLDYKAEVNTQDNNGTSALLAATYANNADLFKLLLKRGANPKLYSVSGRTVMHELAERGNIELAILLLGRVDINAQRNNGLTALSISILYNQSQFFTFLLSVGADPNIAEARGATSLHYAASNCNPDFTQGVLDKTNSSLDATDSNGDTPLVISVRNHCTWNVKYLLQRGASPLIRNVDYHLPIHTAARYGNTEIMEVLVNTSGISIDTPDRSEYTPLMLAAMENKPKMIVYLLEKGADPCPVSKVETTVLHYVVQNQKIEILRKVLACISRRCDIKEEINRQAMHGNTPLASAAAEGSSDVFFYLIENGADPLISNFQGKTSLHFASAGGNVNIIEYLIRNASISVKSTTRAGETALISAAKHGSKDAFEILMKLGSDVRATTNYGESILHSAAIGGNIDIIRVLLKDSAINIDIMDVEGNTPLMYAALRGYDKVVKYLIRENANPLSKNIYGDDALRWAATTGNIPLIFQFPVQMARIDSLIGILLTNNNVNLKPRTLGRLLSMSSISNNLLFISAAKGDDEKLAEIFKYEKILQKKGFPNLLLEFTKEYEDLIEDVIEEDIRFPPHKSFLTPLDMALLFFGKLSTVKLLIENLSINISNVDSRKSLWTPFELACISTGLYDGETSLYKEHVLHYFLRHAKYVINHSDKFGWTVVHKAAWIGNSRVIYTLQQHGADLEKLDKYNRTPLHIAAIKGFHEVVKELLYISNISVNSYDVYGFTPVHLTQIYRIKKFFRRLSKTTITLDPELRYKLLEMVDLTSGQQKNIRPKDHILTMSNLIRNGADINIKDRTFHWTPLHWAAVSGDFNATVFLVTQGAEVNIPSKRGQTPMFLARFWGRKDIYHYLKTKNGVW